MVAAITVVVIALLECIGAAIVVHAINTAYEEFQ